LVKKNDGGGGGFRVLSPIAVDPRVALEGEVVPMPTYLCTSKTGRLTPHQKRKIAGEITRIHCEVTGAPSFFAQVIFDEVKADDWFIGGTPLTHDHIFVYGHIRAGRAAVDKTRMIKSMGEAVALAADVENGRAVWIYVNELPPRQMIEFGQVLPEAGDETAWTAALPEEDRAFMQSIASRNLARTS
jgi:phenylpyruvate tautomerase PptA (4-oxalocrotonate tautomerase family)